MNRHRWRAACAALVVCTHAFAAAVKDRERLVATTDEGNVVYRMVSCSRAIEPKDCHAYEQRRLDYHVRRRWVAAAVKLHKIKLTPEEEAVVRQRVAEAQEGIQRGATFFRALHLAAVSIRRGEDRSKVLAELSKQGIAEQQLDLTLDSAPTLADAERLASRDYVADGREAVREHQTNQFLLAHLRDFVRARAARERVSFEVAEQRFWSEVARASHTRIIDSEYRSPSLKGILVNQ